MSNISVVYGYGFETEYNFQKFSDFLKNHRAAFCRSEKENKLYEEFEQLSFSSGCDIEEFFESYAGDVNEIEGAGSVIANIMYRETGIRFICCLADGDCDTLEAVLFSEKYPWSMTEKEKNLKEKELEKICQDYMSELGIPGHPKYLAQEYFCG